jgi:anthranilate/para-aminobenzoate synthase component I
MAPWIRKYFFFYVRWLLTEHRCIALRTMLQKDGIVYLQAGGGIVHDSVEYDE